MREMSVWVCCIPVLWWTEPPQSHSRWSIHKVWHFAVRYFLGYVSMLYTCAVVNSRWSIHKVWHFAVRHFLEWVSMLRTCALVNGTASESLSMKYWRISGRRTSRMYRSLPMCVCMCVCVCVYIYIYIYIYAGRRTSRMYRSLPMCVYVCMYMCVCVLCVSVFTLITAIIDIRWMWLQLLWL